MNAVVMSYVFREHNRLFRDDMKHSHRAFVMDNGILIVMRPRFKMMYGGFSPIILFARDENQKHATLSIPCDFTSLEIIKVAMEMEQEEAFAYLSSIATNEPAYPLPERGDGLFFDRD